MKDGLEKKLKDVSRDARIDLKGEGCLNRLKTLVFFEGTRSFSRL